MINGLLNTLFAPAAASLALLVSVSALQAQDSTTFYKGLRISAFNINIAEVKRSKVIAYCDIANTGRLPVYPKPRDLYAPDKLVVELDSLTLPTLLQGYRESTEDALRRLKLKLEPGQVVQGVKLVIEPNRKHPAPLPPTQAGKKCPDLVLDTVFMVFFSEARAQLRFILRNNGNQPAPLLGATKSKTDNLALNIYFVSGQKLTRGAQLVEVYHIREGIDTLDGLLPPGQTLAGEIEVNLKTRTRFMPNILLEIDPLQSLEECSRSNNTRTVVAPN